MIEKIPSIIIDDEESNILILEYFILKYFNHIEIKAKCSNYEDALQAISNNEFGIVFLDIELGAQRNGFDLIRLIKDRKFELIVVSAYSNYALEGFELNVTDYILKPIMIDDITRAVNRAIKNLNNGKSNNRDANLIEDKITIHLYSKIIVIDQHEIVFIESDNTQMFIHLKSGERLESTKRIGTMEENLNETLFFRVHKSYIVNLREVSSIEYLNSTMNLILFSNQRIPVARRKKKTIQSIFS